MNVDGINSVDVENKTLIQEVGGEPLMWLKGIHPLPIGSEIDVFSEEEPLTKPFIVTVTKIRLACVSWHYKRILCLDVVRVK